MTVSFALRVCCMVRVLLLLILSGSSFNSLKLLRKVWLVWKGWTCSTLWKLPQREVSRLDIFIICIGLKIL